MDGGSCLRGNDGGKALTVNDLFRESLEKPGNERLFFGRITWILFCDAMTFSDNVDAPNAIDPPVTLPKVAYIQVQC